MSNNQLQNEEMYLPGDLGSVKVNGLDRKIKSVFKGNDGSTTVTVGETITPLEIDGVNIKGIGVVWPEKTITP